MYLLDTNICSYFISQRYPSVTQTLRDKDPRSIFIPSIVAGELAYGVAHSTRVESNRVNLDLFLSNMQVLPWDDRAIWQFGFQKSRLRKLGTPISEIDMLLGCQALALGYVFVTNNTREFERIEGLKLENWA
jgi:tRNA(fMet)-specific endonuclease VapC